MALSKGKDLGQYPAAPCSPGPFGLLLILESIHGRRSGGNSVSMFGTLQDMDPKNRNISEPFFFL